MKASTELSTATIATAAAILMTAAAIKGSADWSAVGFAFSSAYFSGRAAWLAVRIERMRGER
jgi:hypothetical protein